MKRFRTGSSRQLVMPRIHLHIQVILAVVAMLMISFIFTMVARAEETASTTDVKSFLSGMVGEWIGTCGHKTNGEQAEDRYFHVVFEKVNESTFSGRYHYYGLDTKTNTLKQAGDALMTVTVGPNGTITSKVEGRGEVLVNKKPKEQTHVFEEELTVIGDGTITGKGKGKISVSGMPLGLGKNGKIRDSVSRWSISNGVFTIEQKIKADFKALMITKTFDLQANYTAKRGNDVAELINGKNSKISGGVEVSRTP